MPAHRTGVGKANPAHNDVEKRDPQGRKQKNPEFGQVRTSTKNAALMILAWDYSSLLYLINLTNNSRHQHERPHTISNASCSSAYSSRITCTDLSSDDAVLIIHPSAAANQYHPCIQGIGWSMLLLLLLSADCTETNGRANVGVHHYRHRLLSLVSGQASA